MFPVKRFHVDQYLGQDDGDFKGEPRHRRSLTVMIMYSVPSKSKNALLSNIFENIVLFYFLKSLFTIKGKNDPSINPYKYTSHFVVFLQATIFHIFMFKSSRL